MTKDYVESEPVKGTAMRKMTCIYPIVTKSCRVGGAAPRDEVGVWMKKGTGTTTNSVFG